VILGVDDPVAGRAKTPNLTKNPQHVVVKDSPLPRAIQIDELTGVVLHLLYPTKHKLVQIINKTRKYSQNRHKQTPIEAEKEV
jgi:hypothetical protein